jgi:RNA polymerase sigma-70 factor (ECF subfamily)
MPDQPEAWGLLALLTFLSARTPARFDDVGGLVRLEDQDRSHWDAVRITRADGYLVKAASLRRAGRYQLQAALAGVHSSASTWAETDWLQIAMLYDMLAQLDGSPIVRLNQAIAMSHVAGADPALAAVDEMADRLDGYHLFHATRAELLTRRGDHEGARAANARALELTDNPAEQALVHARLDRPVHSDNTAATTTTPTVFRPTP